MTIDGIPKPVVLLAVLGIYCLSGACAIQPASGPSATGLRSYRGTDRASELRAEGLRVSVDSASAWG